MIAEDFRELEEEIGYHFQRKELLKQALTHSSFMNEQKMNRIGDYERLEFLGDAVLEMVSSDFLYHSYPEKPEGELSKLRASMVCEPSLAFCARAFGLERYICLGKGEELTGGRDKDSIVSDVLEALIGATYLDGGIEPAEALIHKYILSDLEHKKLFFDSKSLVQEYFQARGKLDFHYETEADPAGNAAQSFVSRLYLEGKEIATGKGHNKKAAEQKAAYQALMQLQG